MAAAPAKSGYGTETDDPLSLPENRARLEVAKEFAFHLAKGIKNIGIYKHNTSRYQEYVQKAFEALQKFGSQFGPMSIKVEAQCFSMFKEPIFTSEGGDNLPYKFYSDGIRHLIFRPGLGVDEFLRFVLIALSDPRRGEDILAQMWNGGFENIEYIVVEGFSIDDMDDAEVAVEVDKIVGYLYSRLRSDSEDYLRFARVSAEDLEMKLDSVEQMRGVVVSGETANDKLVQKIQDEIKEDEESRLFPKIVTAIFQVIEDGGLTELDALREVFMQLLDSMLLQEDFATINALLVKFRAMERDPARAEVAGALRTFFQSKMGEEQRIRRIGDILASTRLKQPQDAFRYLHSLDETAVVPLLEVLETIEVPENRQIVCDALAALGKNLPDPFVNRLQSEKSQTVRDMIYVIDKCDFPDKMKYFGETLKNPNLAVRLEVLTILSRSRTEQCRRFIIAALSDANAQMRMQAAKVLPNMSPEKALQDLMRVIKAPEFEKREFREKEAVYSALGATNQQGALAHFAQMLQQKSLLRRAKLKEDKLLAIAGIAAMPSIPCVKLLQSVTEDRSNDPEVLTAGRKAFYGMKKALFGDAPEAN